MIVYLSSKGESYEKVYCSRAGHCITMFDDGSGEKGLYRAYGGKSFQGALQNQVHLLLRAWNYRNRKKTRYGIVAGRKEWIGYTAELNAVNEDGSVGEFIGFFEFQDTGAGMDSDGDGIGDTIKDGQSIDVWINSLSEAYAWRDRYGDYVYIKIFKAKG